MSKADDVQVVVLMASIVYRMTVVHKALVPPQPKITSEARPPSTNRSQTLNAFFQSRHRR
jgi:hypothetical protein